jgi:hypothetical protein
MSRKVPLSIIRSLFAVHSAMVYIIQFCRQLSSRTRMELSSILVLLERLSTNLYDIYHEATSSILVLLESCLQICMTLLSVQWINSWWWAEELSDTCRFSSQNKFVKLVHLVGFIIKKCITMHGHTTVKRGPWSLLTVNSFHRLRMPCVPQVCSLVGCLNRTDFHHNV